MIYIVSLFLIFDWKPLQTPFDMFKFKDARVHFRNSEVKGQNWNFILEVSPYFTIVQIIFYFLWDYWAQFGIFENWVLLMYTLEGVNNFANFITAYESVSIKLTPIF